MIPLANYGWIVVALDQCRVDLLEQVRMVEFGDYFRWVLASMRHLVELIVFNALALTVLLLDLLHHA